MQAGKEGLRLSSDQLQMPRRLPACIRLYLAGKEGERHTE